MRNKTKRDRKYLEDAMTALAGSLSTISKIRIDFKDGGTFEYRKVEARTD